MTARGRAGNPAVDWGDISITAIATIITSAVITIIVLNIITIIIIIILIIIRSLHHHAALEAELTFEALLQ